MRRFARAHCGCVLRSRVRNTLGGLPRPGGCSDPQVGIGAGSFTGYTHSEVRRIAQKAILDKLSIYIPQKQLTEKLVERLIELGEKMARSVNYLVVKAILEFLRRVNRPGFSGGSVA